MHIPFNINWIYRNKTDLLIFLIFSLYFGYSIWFKFHRWESLTPSMDYHSYLQMFWNSANGDWLEYNGLKREVRMMFQYHFALILIPLAYIYFLIPHQLTLYFTSTFFLSTSVIPLYFISKRFLNSSIASYFVVLIFLFYPPFINVDLEGFAEEIFVVPIIFWAIYFLLRNQKIMFFTFTILTLTLRINMTAIVFFMGLFAIYQKQKELGYKMLMTFSGMKTFLKSHTMPITLMLISVLWLFFTVFYIGNIFPTAETKHQGRAYIWGFLANMGKAPGKF